MTSALNSTALAGCGAGGAADDGAGVPAVVDGALGAELVDVGGGPLGAAVVGDVVGAEVVGEDHEDVGLARGVDRVGGGGHEGQGGEQQGAAERANH